MARRQTKLDSLGFGVPQVRILLIVPCFNEQESVFSVLDEIRALGDGYDVMVIDDGSTDNTYEVASAVAPTVRLLSNLGIGGAVQTGVKYAAANDYHACIQIDGDGQHPAEEVLKLVETWQQHQCDIVVGSRYLDSDSFRSTRFRRVGSRLVAWTLQLFFRVRVTDPTSGMRLFGHRAIQLFARTYPFDFPEPISLAWAFGRGLTVRECPVKMRSRFAGNSSISGWKVISYPLRVVGYIMLARIFAPNPDKGR